MTEQQQIADFKKKYDRLEFQGPTGPNSSPCGVLPCFTYISVRFAHRNPLPPWGALARLAHTIIFSTFSMFCVAQGCHYCHYWLEHNINMASIVFQLSCQLRQSVEHRDVQNWLCSEFNVFRIGCVQKWLSLEKDMLRNRSVKK